jgi:hypothetical protein
VSGVGLPFINTHENCAQVSYVSGAVESFVGTVVNKVAVILVVIHGINLNAVAIVDA